jgi:P-type Cu2+ transporter
MMLLIALAITVAFVASVLTSLRVAGIDLGFWWELALLIVSMLLGHWLEMRALGQASGALRALAALLPDEAEQVAAQGVRAVPVDALRPGDVVLVRPGGRVPADGTVTEGTADVDESMVTGESKPVRRGVGARVVAGTVATDSSALRVRVEAVGEDTALAGIRRLVEQARTARSRAQALADRFAALLFWFAAAVGVVTFAVWAALGNAGAAVTRTVTVLVPTPSAWPSRWSSPSPLRSRRGRASS